MTTTKPATTRWRIAWSRPADGDTILGEPVFTTLSACADFCRELNKSNKYGITHWPEAVEVPMEEA